MVVDLVKDPCAWDLSQDPLLELLIRGPSSDGVTFRHWFDASGISIDSHPTTFLLLQILKDFDMKSMLLIASTLFLFAANGSAEKPAGFVDLFNGEDLSGWTQRNGTATYRVEDDSIVGRTNEGSPNSFLCSDKLYGDFELTFDVKFDSQLNTGVQIRSQTADGKPDGRVNGPQVEISTDKMAGYVYGEAAGGWMTPDADRKPHDTIKENDWNSYRVLAVGNKIETWINGKQISNLTHDERYQSHPKGFIGLQVHGIGAGQGPFEVRWKNLKLRDLSKITPE